MTAFCFFCGVVGSFFLITVWSIDIAFEEVVSLVLFLLGSAVVLILVAGFLVMTGVV